MAGVDLVRIDGSFPSFSDDDAFILYNEGFTGVSAVARDGSHKQLIFKVAPILGDKAPSSSLFPGCLRLCCGPLEEGNTSAVDLQQLESQSLRTAGLRRG